MIMQVTLGEALSAGAMNITPRIREARPAPQWASRQCPACGQSVELRGGVFAFHNAGSFPCDASGSPGEIGG